MSSSTTGAIMYCERALYRIDKSIDSVIALRNQNLDKPEIWGVADIALDKLAKIEMDLMTTLEEHEQLLTESFLKQLARRVLSKLTSFKKESRVVSVDAALRAEKKIIKRFRLESGKIMKNYPQSHQQSSAPALYWPASSSTPTTDMPHSKPRLNPHDYHNGDQPYPANRDYEESYGTASRDPRVHAQAGAPFTTSGQQDYYNSHTRVQDAHYETNSIISGPPPYSPVRSSQSERHQSGSINSSHRSQNSIGSFQSDQVTRGSHRSTPSGGSYDSRNVEVSTSSRSARVSESVGSHGFGDEDYSVEATHGSMEEYSQDARRWQAQQEGYYSYPPGTGASGSSSHSNYYYSSGYPAQ